jgi:hypothetical protein
MFTTVAFVLFAFAPVDEGRTSCLCPTNGKGKESVVCKCRIGNGLPGTGCACGKSCTCKECPGKKQTAKKQITLDERLLELEIRLEMLERRIEDIVSVLKKSEKAKLKKKRLQPFGVPPSRHRMRAFIAAHRIPAQRPADCRSREGLVICLSRCPH